MAIKDRGSTIKAVGSATIVLVIVHCMFTTFENTMLALVPYL